MPLAGTSSVSPPTATTRPLLNVFRRSRSAIAVPSGAASASTLRAREKGFHERCGSRAS
jgi:hypothetical protein